MGGHSNLGRRVIGRLRMCLSLRFWQSLKRGWNGYMRRERWVLSLLRTRMLFRLRVEGLLHSSRSLRGWSQSKVKIWVDGREFFPRLRQLIRKSQRSIVIQMFIWRDDRLGRELAAALVEAADRGVQVDITKDAMGDGFEFASDFVGTRRSASAPWDRFWRHPAIAVRHFSGGEHAKIFVVDGKVLLLGGMNVGTEYLEWHDYFVELRGRYWVEAFLQGRSILSVNGTVELILNAPGGRMNVRPKLRQLLLDARSSILLEHSYFSDPETIEVLARRSHEGVRVTLILPEAPDVHGHANLQAVDRLMSQGEPRNIRIFTFPRNLHAKLLLVDRRKLFIGSANLIASSLDTLGEANVLIRMGHRKLLRRMRRALRYDMSISKLLVGRRRFSLWSAVLARVGL
ncbi:MAG: phosphatidylserine/phosphatidylglycerophosphate/cardiolipin synthase family protein [Candidatus Peribacteraceae bacterium]|nr:phosphatidylserine/phosphatidylglycerophosphate/cardiolipin synthase family protein [Candidatus Peribacteraceae bacterium]